MLTRHSSFDVMRRMDHLKSHWKTLSHEQREAFASRCNSTVGHIQNVMYGVRPCSAELAVAMELESGGALACEETASQLSWVRIVDKTWPHKGGKPLVDHAVSDPTPQAEKEC